MGMGQVGSSRDQIAIGHRQLCTIVTASDCTVGTAGLGGKRCVNRHRFALNPIVKCEFERLALGRGKALAQKPADVTDKDCIVRVRVSEEDMFKWAVQYAGHAVVLEPAQTTC